MLALVEPLGMVVPILLRGVLSLDGPLRCDPPWLPL